MKQVFSAKHVFLALKPTNLRPVRSKILRMVISVRFLFLVMFLVLPRFSCSVFPCSFGRSQVGLKAQKTASHFTGLENRASNSWDPKSCFTFFGIDESVSLHSGLNNHVSSFWGSATCFASFGFEKSCFIPLEFRKTRYVPFWVEKTASFGVRKTR